MREPTISQELKLFFTEKIVLNVSKTRPYKNEISKNKKDASYYVYHSFKNRRLFAFFKSKLGILKVKLCLHGVSQMY